MHWQRERHWPAPAPHALLTAATVAHLASGTRVTFVATLRAASLAWLHDHRIQGNPLLPGSALFEIAAAAAAAMSVNDAPASSSTRVTLLSAAAIVAPCRLGATNSTTLVTCSINTG